jgi:hypothetical protein
MNATWTMSEQEGGEDKRTLKGEPGTSAPLGDLEVDIHRSFTPGEWSSLTPVLEQVVDPKYPVHRIKYGLECVRP